MEGVLCEGIALPMLQRVFTARELDSRWSHCLLSKTCYYRERTSTAADESCVHSPGREMLKRPCRATLQTTLTPDHLVFYHLMPEYI